MANILIVDDQANVRTAVLQLLLSCNRSDLTIDQATNGSDALRRLQAKKYDLLISDTEMPGMNGADLMHAVRADEKLKQLPAILMLAVGAGKQDVLDAVALGISGFIIKPFRPEQLRAQIKKVMGW
ncbi:MAG: response regulator [Propionivibrio sp.]|jgi:two-component system, chemotaxis family, chemotaxis protein CheY|uniref:response regulator n=1 Tax=Propionivibrio sp. TaxID=2212460 RepID=UPI001B64D8B4|nr:response regulator [Propionivibrio sp.]MBP7203752.1 response regulator [Propionivibrio sp.]